MRVSEHANYLLNEYGRLQFDYAAYCKPNGESLRNEARNNLEEYIAELEAAQRWIPVSEKLPEDYISVLGTGGKSVCECRHSTPRKFDYACTGWHTVDGFCMKHVTHWMPLPEPPIVYGKVCEE